MTEEDMADVAAATLARLVELRDELGHLADQMGMLSYWAHENHLAPAAEHCMLLEHAARRLLCECAAESVRDIAQTLPLRLDGHETVRQPVSAPEHPPRCGRRTRGGSACRTLVSRPGDGCRWHREVNP